MKVLKRIPFIILISASISLVGLRILDHLAFKEGNKSAFRILNSLFSHQPPFNFRVWLFFLFCAIVLAVILAVSKKYRFWETVIGIGGNMLLFVLMVYSIAPYF